MPARRGLIVLGAVALAAIGGVSAARRPVPSGLVNWPLSGRIARRVSGAPPAWRPQPALAAEYQAIVQRSYAEVASYTGGNLSLEADAVRVLGRAEWIETNLANFEHLLAPLVEAYQRTQTHAGAAGRLAAHGARAGVTGQIGLLLGYLGRRVLGQYDIPLLDADADGAGVYFVEPNIARAAHAAGAAPRDLRLWVALHEATHAFQFQVGDPPWLRGYTAALVQAYLADAVRALESQQELPRRMQDLWDRIGRGGLTGAGLLRLALTDAQTAALARIQALMTLMEGYSNHVMRVTGRAVIPNFPTLEARMRGREQARGPASRALTRLLGLDLKLEQYRIGEQFVQQVVDARGLCFMNSAWRGPALLPTLAETRDPASWIARVDAADGGAAADNGAADVGRAGDDRPQ